MRKILFSAALLLITMQAVHAQNWSLAGNAAVSGNVLGTTNSFPLNFVLGGKKGGIVEGTYTGSHYNTGIGYLSLQSASGSNPPIENTALGYAALGGAQLTGSFNVANGATTLQYNTTGQYNTGIGRQTLNYNTTGSYNLANGGQSLYTNVTGSNNTAVGYGSLFNSTVSNLTAVGYQSMYSNTTGAANVATGYQSMYSNTTGAGNVANGFQSMYSNTTGAGNVATGSQSLFANTTGYANTASGFEALGTNSTGSSNTANGSGALLLNTVGEGNTGVGVNALYSNTTGLANTALGFEALYANTTVGYLTAVGYQTLYSNTTGAYNAAIGYLALYSNTTGSENTANGYEALYANTTGSYNTAFGTWSNDYNTTGSNNTAYGYTSLNTNVTGSNLTAVGSNAQVNADGFNDASAFGYNATTTASYQTVIGDASQTSIGGYANWTNISDGRVKKNIKQNVPGLAFINQLQPITYNLDLDAIDQITQPPVHKDAKGNVIQPTQQELAGRSAKENIVYTGFIAQDVEKAAKGLNYNFSGVDASKNSKNLYGLRYAEFVVPLVKAVQELSAANTDKQQQVDSLKNMVQLIQPLQVQNTQLQSDVSTLQQQMTDLKSTIAQMQSAMSQCCNSFSSNMQSAESSQQVTTITDMPKLDQNVPNPFNGSSYISYYIPQGFHSAQLMVVDISGNVMKTYGLANSGYGKQVISGSEMAAGMYQYSLLIDGKLIDTKKMMLTK